MVAVMPYSRAASISHCRTRRSPATYCLIVFVWYASL